MKKIFIILLATGLVTTLHAQPTNLPAANTKSVSVNSNNVLVGQSTNLFKANSNLLNQAIAASGGGTGTVTSVALSVPAEFSVAGSPITGAGTLAVTKATQSSNTFWAGPASGAAATPGFRALLWADFGGLVETNLTFTAPLTRTINAIGLPVATSGANGYLSSADWTTFNAKADTSITNNYATTASVNTTSNALMVRVDGSGTNLSLYASTTNKVPLVLNSQVGQNTNTFEIKGTNGTVVTAFGPNGGGHIGGGTAVGPSNLTVEGTVIINGALQLTAGISNGLATASRIAVYDGNKWLTNGTLVESQIATTSYVAAAISPNFVQIAESGFSNTVTETSMISNGNGSMTITGGVLRAGSVVTLNMMGLINTSSATAANLIFKATLGGTTLQTSPTITMTASLSNRTWIAEFRFVCFTNGASGTIQSGGRVIIETTDTGSTLRHLKSPGTATVDLTTNNVFGFTGTFAVANNTNALITKMVLMKIEQ